jgi:hypothetical protein
VDEGEEHDVEFLKAGEDAPIAFQAPEEAFHLVPAPIEETVIVPGLEAILFRGDDRNPAEIEHELPRLVAFIGAVHEDGDGREGFGQGRQ